MDGTSAAIPHVPWNKGKLVGQKTHLKVKDIRTSAEHSTSVQFPSRSGSV